MRVFLKKYWGLIITFIVIVLLRIAVDTAGQLYLPQSIFYDLSRLIHIAFIANVVCLALIVIYHKP